MAPIVIAIDGLIGSGKTTLLRNLQQQGFVVVTEQCHTWKFLKKFYENPKKYSLAFQIEVLLSFNEYKFPDDVDIVFVERCPQVNRSVFGKLLVSDGNLSDEEMATYSDIYDNLNIWKPDHYIFLDCPVEVAMDRLKKRGETNTITQEYMKRLLYFYEVFNRYANSNIVDSTVSEETVMLDVLKLVKSLIS
jgi:NADH dehydrogenase (ubiquinone) 1 alpha subcomplex subunit 10